MKKRNNITIISGTLAGLFLMTGCVPTLSAPEPVKEEPVKERSMWQDTSRLEEHYSLKPEPYSLESNEHDPELLGPQSTIKRSLTRSEMAESGDTVTGASDSEEKFLPREEAKQATTTTMTRSRCISLIGKAKYDEYTKRYGSEAAALRKCTILQHVQK